MSNAYYNYSGAFIPGTLARAEAEAAEFIAVQQGFNLLSNSGTESGSGNAFTVTTINPLTSYADGYPVYFKATHSNSGAATINVNSIGSVALLRNNGTASQSGDIVSGTWYYAVYNSTYSAFTILAPLNIVAYTGLVSGAAPTHKVGLTAAGGVSTSAIPIDVTFAIDQSIAPTWSAAHTWTANMTLQGDLTKFLVLNSAASQIGAIGTQKAVLGSGNTLVLGIASSSNTSFYPGGGTTSALDITANGVTVNAPASSGTALTVGGKSGNVALAVGGQGGAGSYIATFINNGSLVNGSSYGIEIIAGVGSADTALVIKSASGSNTFFQIFGDGSGTIGYNTVGAIMQFTAAGLVSINTPGSAGHTLSINGYATSTYFPLNLNGSTTSGSSNGLSIFAGYVTADYLIKAATRGSGGTAVFSVFGDGSCIIGNTAVNGPTLTVGTTGDGITVTAPAASQRSLVIAGQTSGSASPVVQINAGQNSAVLLKLDSNSKTTVTAINFGPNTYSTGSATPSLGTNKPGSNSSPTAWVFVQYNGSAGYMPIWT